VFDPKNPPKQNAFTTTLKTKIGHPRLLIVANRNISAGEEILFDYGERRPEVIKQQPWLEPESNPKRSSRLAAGKC
jgi:SET domain-containing protein